eukprot:2346089-Rhodomonas_salina.2
MLYGATRWSLKPMEEANAQLADALFALRTKFREEAEAQPSGTYLTLINTESDAPNGLQTRIRGVYPPQTSIPNGCSYYSFLGVPVLVSSPSLVAAYPASVRVGRTHFSTRHAVEA